MKKIVKKLNTLIIGSALVVSGSLVLISTTSTSTHAQCTSGNAALEGYATTSNNLGRIFMTDEAWESYTGLTTSEDFAVTYNRELGTWSGKGHSDEVGWIDFGSFGNSNNVLERTAEIYEVREDTTGAWGNWDQTIYLDAVSYNQDPGGFEGEGVNAEYTSGLSNPGDDPVGMGLIDFSNVILTDDCDENINASVDVFVNTSSATSSVIYQETCPIQNVELTWNTSDIISGSCVTDGGIWGTTGSKADNNTTGEAIAGNDITAANTPQLFVLRCEVAGSPGTYIEGQAFASCGTTDPGGPGNPADGIVIPEFKEV